MLHRRSINQYQSMDPAFTAHATHQRILPSLLHVHIGNPSLGIGSGTFSFQVEDTTPPFITDYIPALGASGVSMDPATSFMRLTFNEPVAAASKSHVQLHHAATNALAATIAPADMAMEGDGKTLRLIVPWGSLQQSTEYVVTTDNLVAGLRPIPDSRSCAH